jgi:hypothetical protein
VGCRQWCMHVYTVAGLESHTRCASRVWVISTPRRHETCMKCAHVWVEVQPSRNRAANLSQPPAPTPALWCTSVTVPGPCPCPCIPPCSRVGGVMAAT